MADMIRAGIVDDDRMLTESIRGWFASAGDMCLAAAAATVEELLAGQPTGLDVVLLDLRLKDGSDPAANVRRLLEYGTRVLVVSVCDDPAAVTSTLIAGAAGYLTKDHDLAALANAIRDVAAGLPADSAEEAFALLTGPVRPDLSSQERAVIQAYTSGMTLKAVARHLGISPDTAKTYLERAKAKYRSAGRPTFTKIDLAMRVREDGL